ncbi:MAG: PAS domain S-box protein, partial [Thermoplasmatota archaeon]
MPDFSKIRKDFALQYTDESIFMLNEKGKILHTTSDVKRICGLKKETILQKTFPSIVRKEDKKIITKFLTDLTKKPKAKNTITFQIPTKKEATHYFQLRAINLLSEPGVNLIIAYVRNITTQKQIEQDLHRKNKEFKELLDFHQIITDNTIDVIFQVTLSGTYTFMNKASKRIAGYDPAEMIGKKWMSFVPKKELPKYLGKVKELLKGKKIDDFQTFVIHKEGYLVPVEFSGSIIKKNDKTYITGVMRDLSKRMDSKRELEDLARALEKQAKAKTKELQKSEMKYRRLIENANEAIIVAQQNFIQFANPNAINLFGYSEKELFAKPFIDFIHPEDKDLVLKRYKQRIEGKLPPSRYEFRIMDKQNNVHWVEISAVKFEWNGKPATL